MIYSSKCNLMTFIFGGVLSVLSSTAMATHSINLDAHAAAQIDQLSPALHAEYEKVLTIVHHIHSLGIHHHTHVPHKELYRSAEGTYHVPTPRTHPYAHSKVSHAHHHAAPVKHTPHAAPAHDATHEHHGAAAHTKATHHEHSHAAGHHHKKHVAEHQENIEAQEYADAAM